MQVTLCFLDPTKNQPTRVSVKVVTGKDGKKLVRLEFLRNLTMNLNNLRKRR
ncbi:MAG: hypothetical protein L6U99_04055 [Clostridium sp.]|nr:MAG: hypothetical protein L6U99_04055 [Clostridium sp.]